MLRKRIFRRLAHRRPFRIRDEFPGRLAKRDGLAFDQVVNRPFQVGDMGIPALQVGRQAHFRPFHLQPLVRHQRCVHVGRLEHLCQFVAVEIDRLGLLGFLLHFQRAEAGAEGRPEDGIDGQCLPVERYGLDRQIVPACLLVNLRREAAHRHALGDVHRCAEPGIGEQFKAGAHAHDGLAEGGGDGHADRRADALHQTHLACGLQVDALVHGIQRAAEGFHHAGSRRAKQGRLPADLDQRMQHLPGKTYLGRIRRQAAGQLVRRCDDVLENLVLRLDGVAGQQVEAAGRRPQRQAGDALRIRHQPPDAGHRRRRQSGKEAGRPRQVERILPSMVDLVFEGAVWREIEGAHFGIRSTSLRPLASRNG